MSLLHLKGTTFSFDTETTGLAWHKGDEAFLLSFFTEDHDVILVDLRTADKESVKKQLIELFSDPTTRIIMFNAKFDLHMMMNLTGWFEVKARVIDIQTMYRISKNDMIDGNPTLKLLASEYGYEKDSSVDHYVKLHKCGYHEVPNEIMYKYAAMDAEITFKLYFSLYQRLAELDIHNTGLGSSIFELLSLESRTTLVLLRIERVGVKLDQIYLQASTEREQRKATEKRAEIEKTIGRTFVDSNKNLRELFKDDTKLLAKCGRTKTGTISFTDAALSSSDSKLAKAISEFRQYNKRLNTYFTGYSDAVGKDGRIHGSFNQATSRTGRLSSTNPNMQNVPSVDEDSTEEQFLESKMIRDCFEAADGNYFVSIDYQAQEYRVLLDLSEQMDLIEAIKGGADPHGIVATMMGVIRKISKTIGFGLLYGMGTGKLGETLGITYDKADSYKKLYFSKLPKVADFINSTMKKADSKWLATMFGRVYHFQDYFDRERMKIMSSSYKAVNYLIQGTCSDIMRKALILIDDFIMENKLDSRIVLTIHDEICFEIPEHELKYIKDFQRLMSNAYPHKHLPLETGVEIGKKWGSMEGFDEWLKKQKPGSVTL